jgi:hypothetical protein
MSDKLFMNAEEWSKSVTDSKDSLCSLLHARWPGYTIPAVLWTVRTCLHGCSCLVNCLLHCRNMFTWLQLTVFWTVLSTVGTYLHGCRWLSCELSELVCMAAADCLMHCRNLFTWLQLTVLCIVGTYLHGCRWLSCELSELVYMAAADCLVNCLVHCRNLFTWLLWATGQHAILVYQPQRVLAPKIKSTCCM